MTPDVVRPLVYTSPYWWIFAAVFLFAFVPEFGLMARSRPAPGEKTDRGSTAVIAMSGWIGMMAAFAVARMPAFLIVRGQKIWFALGLAALLCGTMLRRHCWRVLGRYFTGNVKAESDQPVIQEGAYRWIRHPSYSGGMLMYIGVGLALTNWLSLLIIAGTGFAAYLYRVRVEERALVEKLGSRYEEYMRRTKRFIPFVI
jgi:protein-S-isoprenylcysteine O-methyltransferase Ste14